MLVVAEYERCLPDTGTNIDLKAMRTIATRLMNGYNSEESGISLPNPGQWKPVAANFLADTTSANSLQELQIVSYILMRSVLD
jgi:hypothetical protein